MTNFDKQHENNNQSVSKVAPARRTTRRDFFRTTVRASAAVGAAACVGYWSGTQAAHADESSSPNERPVIGYIGTGIRFHTALGKGGMAHAACAAIADVDAVQAGRALQVAYDMHRQHGYPLNVATHEDYRHVLDRADVDAVFVGTPDHWHTKVVIDAMKAGKDVYCEKPLTLTIREGQQIAEVMKQTGRIVQVGTQQRTEFGQRFATAVAMARDGRVGELKTVTAAIGGSRKCDSLPVVDVPRGLNWDMWLGQAPVVDYREGPLVDVGGWGAGHPFARTHRYYRWWYEYSGGKLTDWGAHHVDIAMWAMNKLDGSAGVITVDPLEVTHPMPFDKNGNPTEVDRFNAATKFKVKITFDDGLEFFVRHAADDKGFGNGVMFEGAEGRFFVNRGKLTGKPVEMLADNPLPEDAIEKLHGCPLPKSHIANFFDCMKSRAQPISDVISHNRMLAVCHVVNIAMRLNRKLTFDTNSETFVNDPQADSFVGREQRKGYEINV